MECFVDLSDGERAGHDGGMHIAPEEVVAGLCWRSETFVLSIVPGPVMIAWPRACLSWRQGR